MLYFIQLEEISTQEISCEQWFSGKNKYTCEQETLNKNVYMAMFSGVTEHVEFYLFFYYVV